ncbi:MAG: flavodoxin domain-containing protein [Lachnospiraceae bacterium]|nr:flavodoxin domain-containing protein [Lachnospiraceae bacterium]
MKYLVTYSSKYGSTQKYAKWIGEALSCEVKEVQKVDPKMMHHFDVVIHRTMMWMLCRTMKKKGYDNLPDEDKLMLDTYGKKIDFSDQSSIKNLVDYVTSYSH